MILCVVFGVIVALSLTDAQSCLVDTFPVQDDFDVSKWAGKWYEVSWVQYYYEPPYDNYLDYAQEYTAVNTTYVTAVSAGRATANSPDCIRNKEQFIVSSSEPAKWTFNQTVNDTVLTLDHWIISTDYDNYAFVYGCTKRHDNGTCQYAHAWKWSRSQQMAPQYVEKVDAAVAATCMQHYSFSESRQNKECSLVASGADMTSYARAILLVAILSLSRAVYII